MTTTQASKTVYRQPGAQEGLGTGLVYAVAPAVIVLPILVGLGRLILRPLFQLVAATKSNELFVPVCWS